MRSNIYMKLATVVILSVILVFLIFIIYDKTGKMTGIYVPPLSDYEIINENDTCHEGEELIYEDDNYSYYLPCLSSYKIYLQWTDGDKDLIKNAINNKKVTIESLIEHGLEVVKHEK